MKFITYLMAAMSKQKLYKNLVSVEILFIGIGGADVLFGKQISHT